MANNLLYYKPRAILHSATADLPGTKELSYFFRLYNAGSVPIDRTGTFTTPVRVKSIFPIPAMAPMGATFEEICNERALELLARSDKIDAQIYVLWSGGIDSTLVLVSLLKNATPAQKERLVVLLSELSINENPVFFQNFIRGTLKTETASVVPYILGSRHILTSGEANDQIFGSDMTAALIAKFGANIIHRRFERPLLFSHFNEALKNPDIANLYLDLFERLWAKAPFPLVSFFDHLWWVNFSLKWQTVYTRMLTYTAPRNAEKITADYVREHYLPFYKTEKFQLWSLNNHDKKIKDTWVSYKWPCKDIIYDFTKDAEYRDTKVKVGSLSSFVCNQVSYEYIDENFKPHPTLDLAAYYESDNDFILS